jgi:hypothetical protein
LISKTVNYGAFQLEQGWGYVMQSYIRQNVLSDNVNLVQAFGGGTSYNYHNLEKMVTSRIKNHGTEVYLFRDYVMFDSIKLNESRSVMSLF